MTSVARSTTAVAVWAAEASSPYVRKRSGSSPGRRCARPPLLRSRASVRAPSAMPRPTWHRASRSAGSASAVTGGVDSSSCGRRPSTCSGVMATRSRTTRPAPATRCPRRSWEGSTLTPRAPAGIRTTRTSPVAAQTASTTIWSAAATAVSTERRPFSTWPVGRGLRVRSGPSVSSSGARVRTAPVHSQRSRTDCSSRAVASSWSA